MNPKQNEMHVLDSTTNHHLSLPFIAYELMEILRQSTEDECMSNKRLIIFTPNHQQEDSNNQYNWSIKCNSVNYWDVLSDH